MHWSSQRCHMTPVSRMLHKISTGWHKGGAVHLLDMLQGLAIISRCHSLHRQLPWQKKILPMGAQEHPVGTLLCLEISEAALTSQPRCQHCTEPELMLLCGSSSSACKHQQQHKKHRYWNRWKGDLSKLERFWGFVTWLSPFRAASPSPLWGCSRTNRQCQFPNKVSGENRLPCLGGLWKQTWPFWIQTSGTSGQASEEGVSACKMEKGKPGFYHRESHSLSLIPGADDGKTPPASSLAKKRKKIMF